MKTTRFGWALLLTFGFAICTSGIATASTSVDDNATEIQKIHYFDSKTFDKKLSAALAKEVAAVTVIFPTPFKTNDIPKRIDKWLTAIDEYGGTIDLVPEEIQRGLFDDWLSLLERLYTEIQEKLLYRPARNYDVTMYYKTEAGTITRLVFTRKES